MMHRAADLLAAWWVPRWLWKLYPRRLKAWLWLNADLNNGERTMSPCRTCKWWGRSHRGYCDRIDMAPELFSSAHAVIEVAVADDHGLEARLRTGPEFGCTFHETVNPYERDAEAVARPS